MPTSSQNFTTAAGTLYDHNVGIRPLFYDLNLGIAYDINGDGNMYFDRYFKETTNGRAVPRMVRGRSSNGSQRRTTDDEDQTSV